MVSPKKICLALVSFIVIFSNSNIQFSRALTMNRQSTFIPVNRKAPLYTIDLDKNPRDRWVHVVRDYKNETQSAIKQYLGTIPKELLFLATIAASKLDSLLPRDFSEEIKGIADTVEAPLGDIVLLNIIYDVTAHCTGIIANDKSGGIWHGRNLDYGQSSGQTGILEAATIRVDFVKNGSLAFSAATFAGYVGVLTAWKPNAFAITINERDQGSLGKNLISAAIELLKGNALHPVSMLARISLQQDPDYSSATRRLMQSQLIAPAYYIVSGNSTDQGMVIVRDQFSVLGVNALDQAAGKWFVVQTNYDYWVQPPSSDDRRDPAIRSMNRLGQARVAMETILQVLSLHPVLNNHTAYTSVFSAAYANQSVTVIR